MFDPDQPTDDELPALPPEEPRRTAFPALLVLLVALIGWSMVLAKLLLEAR